MEKLLKHNGQIVKIGGNTFKINQADSGLDDLAMGKCSVINEDGVAFVCTSAMANQNTILNISLPNCSYIGSQAFYSCSSLATLTIPKCSYIYNGAFRGCNAIASLCAPECSIIEDQAFYWANNLSILSLPKCKQIGNDAFYACAALSEVTLPECETIGLRAFDQDANYRNYSLRTISLPKCKVLGSSAFDYNLNLSQAFLPECSIIYPYAFRYCTSLATISMPNCTSLAKGAFLFDRNLPCISLSKQCSISNDVFRGAYNLSALYLYYPDGLCTLGGDSTFTSTPIGGYSVSAGCYGSIYVYPWLLESYKTATYWSLYSERFISIQPPADKQFIYQSLVTGITCSEYTGSILLAPTTLHYLFDRYSTFSSIIISNASYSWNESTYTLELTDPTDTVYVTITANDISPTGGNTFATASEIDECRSYNAVIDGNGYAFGDSKKYTLFKFTPSESGTYSFYATGGGDSYGRLFNSDESSITFDNDGAGNRKFKITQALIANTVYYIGIAYYSSSNTGTIPFTISKS